MANWKRRYTFRLTDEDKDIYDYIESSSESNSETVRNLLRYALTKMNEEDKETHASVISMLNELKFNQQRNYETIMDRLEQGVSTNQDDQTEKVDEVISDSANALLHSFGVDF